MYPKVWRITNVRMIQTYTLILVYNSSKYKYINICSTITSKSVPIYYYIHLTAFFPGKPG